jgi:hypothetical protein
MTMLSEQQKKLAEGMASGLTVTEASIAAECHRNNYYNKWRNEPEFMAYLKELEDAAKDEAKRIMLFNAAKVAKKLVKIATNAREDTPSVNACKAIFSAIGLLTEDRQDNTGEPERLTADDITARLAVIKAKDTEQSNITKIG